jgi:hypothetical protein
MNFLGRLIIGAILTSGMWYFYNKNVLSKLDIDAQIEEFESSEAFDEYDDYDDRDDDDYAYDDYDTESDW